jgi:pilus assembly protein Flp/PilA
LRGQLDFTSALRKALNLVPDPTVPVVKARKAIMSQVSKIVRRLGKDEDGAALIEYTVLLGILVVTVIATIVFVGGWVNNKWTLLSGQLS